MDNQHTATMVDTLDATETQPQAVALRELTYGLLGLDRTDARVLDVGSGTGRAVAELHAQGVDAVGIEPDPDILNTARSRWPECGFDHGHAEELPFPDSSFTGYRADKVLHELPDPAAALTEARRVLRPSGRIVLLGQDWTSITIVAVDQDLASTIVRAAAASIPSATAPMRSRELLLDAGFRNVQVQVVTGLLTAKPFLGLAERLADTALNHNVITSTEHATWLDEQRQRAARDRLQIAMPMYLAHAST